MHPTQSENLSHTSWIAHSPIGVSPTTSLLNDIPKLRRLVCRKKSPNCSSAHSTICECCYFKRWWKSQQRAKSSLSPSCASILNIFQFLQQLFLQQKHCWLQHNSGFWKSHHMPMSEWHIQVLWAKFWTSFCQILTVIEPHGVIPVSLRTYSLLGVFLLLC